MRLVIAAICWIGCTSSDPLRVTIDTGVVHGHDEGSVRAFLGIPYASPPVGDLRWRAPQPAPHWGTPLEAIEVGQQCPQTLSYAGPSYDEDCLYLNVWAPSGAKNLPVMVWLHGGAFIFGSGGDKYYDGASLASQGVVIVTINYRLGVLGFFAHPSLDGEDSNYPTAGNYGLEDQRFALQWVQRNIAAFGGDPKRVTLFGESAGGMSTCIHYVSSRADDLFANALAESGLCGAALLAPSHANAESAGLTLASSFNCTGNGASALACMRAIDAQTLLMATNLPPATTMMPGGPLYQPSLLPNVLPNVDGVVFAQPLRDGFNSATYLPRPLLLGTNKDEGTLLHSMVYGIPVTNDTDYRTALAVRFGSGAVDAIVARYPIASYPTPNDALAAVTGDAFFVCPTRRSARAASQFGAPVFRYSFEQALDPPFMQGLGVFHSAEIPFVFGNDDYPLGRVGGGAELVPQMQAFWTSFAKSGGPSDTWPAYDAGTDPYQVLAVPLGSGVGLKTALCDFWDTLP